MRTSYFATLPLSSRHGFCAILLLFSLSAPLVYDHAWRHAVETISPLAPSLLVAILSLACSYGMSLVARGRGISPLAVVRDTVLPAMLTLAANPAVIIWQPPRTWMDLFSLSPLCATFTVLAHMLVVGMTMAKKGRHSTILAQGSLFIVPFLMNWLLLLQSPALVTQLGNLLTGALQFTPRAQELAGRVLILAGFNLAAATLLNVLCIERLLREPKTLLLLLASAVFGGLAPAIADLGTTETVVLLPPATGMLIAVLTAAVAQAALWAETFLITGLLMDALKGRRPVMYWGGKYFREGLGKGAAYSFLFLGILLLVDGMSRSSLLASMLQFAPLLTHVLIGAAIMPLAKTVLESFDGSRPFFSRLADSYREPHLCLRGAILGVALHLVPAEALIHKAPGDRFVLGALIGILAYAGANLLLDLLAMAQGRRVRLQSWRTLVTGGLLGGFVGGAIAWYLDAGQTKVILDKYHLYTTLRIPGAHDYIIYPLFSKWGAMNLGLHSGSARILFNESVSGVINWSLAAPLFSVNLFVLTALFARSMEPIRKLASHEGFVAVAEQTVRVLRWGLWMAPVIYSLLRISGDPTWYNQDGAIRTLTAAWESISLTPEGFRAWSIQTFLYLLAYDWFRILIWFDHMGLRVATLVNLSFVGGDALDELLAAFQGHPSRTRCIPEALRRFATWAPLLIPFFLPQGADWAHVWDGAEAIQKSGQGQISAASVLLLIFALLAAALLIFFRRPRPRIPQAVCIACGLDRPGFCPPDEITLNNGVYALVQGRDGRGYSRVFSSVRHGVEYDLTNRPTSRAHNVGKFLYLHDEEEAWSLGCRPMHGQDAGTIVKPLGLLAVRMESTYRGIRAVADITLPPNRTAELCRVRLTNTDSHPRRLELSTYREICLNDPNPQLRHPFFNRQHVATWFQPELGAVFSRNRSIKTAHGSAISRRPSPEVYFHAAKSSSGHGVTLLGFEDNRGRFVGDDTLRAPGGLSQACQPTDSRELRYTFDPIASLRLEVLLAPGETKEIQLVDGYAPSAAAGTRLVQELLHLRRQSVAHPEMLEGPERQLDDPGVSTMLNPPAAEEYTFSDDGTELHMGWQTPRRWSHLMVNEQGYGTLVSNDGGMASFMSNSQQNALTPFSPDAMTAQTPGQVLYLKNRNTDALTSPTYIPYREKDAHYNVTYGPGYSVFRKTIGDLRTELTAFVLHDRPVEARILRIANTGSSVMDLDLTFFAQIVLAEVPVDSAGKIDVQEDTEHHALYFRNPHNRFHQGWAFVAASQPLTGSETSLARFLGDGRDFEDPHMVLYGFPDVDQEDDGYKAAVLQTGVTVQPGAEVTLHLLLGQAKDLDTCRSHLRTLADTSVVEQELEKSKQWWRDLLGTVRVTTSSPALDRLVNVWLPYQTLTARLWGRLGPNQRSGAFGFRDQLQDVLPLCILRPQLARDQILLHARQQFLEGDVLQWWHQTWDAKTGLGMRNRASDPHLWLPYLTCQYIAVTGDTGILDEMLPYIEGRTIPRHEEGFAQVPRPSREVENLYQHCLRAVDLTLSRLGQDGLPLMCAHDWNDGLSTVSNGGGGVSTWLGFFLHDVLRAMLPLVRERDGEARATTYADHAAKLRIALQSMWRTDHFARAVTDRGEVLDYADALCAAWPVLSGAVNDEQGAMALRTGLASLEKANQVLLLTPHFDEHSRPYPGRIADYPPGVRENGGQYSHGASWLVDALTALAARPDNTVEETYRWREDALRVWLKISPLAHVLPDELAVYGLPPHQQPADIYYGPGYEGRGGWSWYTGAAARMLWAAYGLLGVGMADGRPQLHQGLLEQSGTLDVRKVELNGVTVFEQQEQA